MLANPRPTLPDFAAVAALPAPLPVPVASVEPPASRGAPDVSLERLRAELRRLQRWVYAVLLGGLVPPPTVFLIVPQGRRQRASWYVPGCWQAGQERPDEICLAGEALREPFSALLAVVQAILEQAATAAMADPRPSPSPRRYRRVKALAGTIGLSLQRSRGGRWLSPRCSASLRQRILTAFVPHWSAFVAVRQAPPAPRRPKAPRWRCACPRARSIRRVNFNASCRTCGATFTRADPWPSPPIEETCERSPAATAPRDLVANSAGTHGTAEHVADCRFPTGGTAEQRNGGTLSSSAAARGAPAEILEPVLAECRRLFRYTNAALFLRPLQHEPQFVVQPQGSRKTPTWFVPASWHGAGPPRPEIGIAAEALRDPPAVYAGILHELTHQWNWEQNTPDVHPRRNYHRAAFRKAAEAIGLVVERAGGRGCAQTSLSQALSERLEQDFQWDLAAFAAFRLAQPPAPGLPRWECGCPIRLRGTRLAIHCHDCQTDFTRVEADAEPVATGRGTGRPAAPWTRRTPPPLRPRPPPGPAGPPAPVVGLALSG